MPSITVWKCACGSGKSRTTGCSALRHRMLRRAGEDLRDFLPPPRELRARHARIGHFVDDVVDLAAERVQRGDRAPARRRQEQEAVVEARPALRRLLLAVLVGRHRAIGAPGCARSGHAPWDGPPLMRHPRWTQRAVGDRAPVERPQRGPAREHVAVHRVDALQDAQAAGDDRRQFESEAPRQRAHERSPGFEQRAGAATSNAISARQRSSARAGGDRGGRDAEAVEVLLRQVDAVLAPVDRHVLPEVGELQSGADRVAGGEVGRASAPGTAQAAAGRPGRPSGGSSRASVAKSAYRVVVTSWVNADSRSWNGANGRSWARIAAASAGKGGSAGVSPRSIASSACAEAGQRGDALRRAARRPRRPGRRRRARTGRSRRPPGAAWPARDATRQGNSRNDQPTRESPTKGCGNEVVAQRGTRRRGMPADSAGPNPLY